MIGAQRARAARARYGCPGLRFPAPRGNAGNPRPGGGPAPPPTGISRSMAVSLGLGLERGILSPSQLFQSPLNGGKQVQSALWDFSTHCYENIPRPGCSLSPSQTLQRMWGRSRGSDLPAATRCLQLSGQPDPPLSLERCPFIPKSSHFASQGISLDGGGQKMHILDSGFRISAYHHFVAGKPTLGAVRKHCRSNLGAKEDG
ncbi:PREDICTED: uncharacterized protein LOC108445719 [Corvus brachyrhynchos]|uniref:uncharacterized protein LOC108445719 n=1 Tax=Corvus brachyrhynchos TaxID=85066 RepID=UPI000816344F|nr:PREDICTED: uncharacterized protein LOC108445719 [Corvus brachyrhynchos]